MNRRSFTDLLTESLQDRRLFIKLGATNGRLGIDSLSAYAMAAAPEAVLDGAVFAFCTKMHNQIRLLLWDRGGYWLITRKVYRGFFIWPEAFEDRESIQACYEQLRVLLKDSRALKREAVQTCRDLENSVTEKV